MSDTKLLFHLLSGIARKGCHYAIIGNVATALYHKYYLIDNKQFTIYPDLHIFLKKY